MLPQSRKMVLDAVQAEVAVFEGQERNSYCKYLLSKFEEEKDPKTPYIGIAIWWLKDYIKGAS